MCTICTADLPVQRPSDIVLDSDEVRLIKIKNLVVEQCRNELDRSDQDF